MPSFPRVSRGFHLWISRVSRIFNLIFAGFTRISRRYKSSGVLTILQIFVLLSFSLSLILLTIWDLFDTNFRAIKLSHCCSHWKCHAIHLFKIHIKSLFLTMECGSTLKCKQLSWQKKRAYKRAKKLSIPADWEHFKQLTNECGKAFKSAFNPTANYE